VNPSDEIKARLDVVEVIRGYIDLKPAGVNFRANCPFHHEKSPSFVVSPDKQIWHCFGCGKGGDIFGFVMEYENLDFVEALRLLAPRAGVTLKQVDPKQNSRRSRVLDAMELAAKYYHHVLMTSQQAEPARQYLKKRGLDEVTVEEWRIGYSPESWDDLVNFLASRGFSPDEIFAAGLSIRKEGNSRYYNRFRGRIMFPIFDANSSVVAFTARVSPEREATEQMGKYINSPQTIVYDKSKVLFGLNRAKQAIRTENFVILVEGQMDVITAHQFGFKNVVATSGTALTTEQLTLLKRHTPNILLALDADSAGQEAVQRGEQVAKQLDYQEVETVDSHGRIRRYIDPSQSFTLRLKVIIIPSGKDPDECIRTDINGWRQAVASAIDVMTFHFERAFAGINTKSSDDRRKVLDQLLPKIAQLGQSDRSEQGVWLKELSQRLNLEELALREDLMAFEKQLKNQHTTGRGEVQKITPLVKSREEQLSELALALMIKFSELIGYAIRQLQPDQLVGQENRLLYNFIVIYYNNSNQSTILPVNPMHSDAGETESEALAKTANLGYSGLRQWLRTQEDTAPAFNGTVLSQLDYLALLADKEFYHYEANEPKVELTRIIAALKKSYLKNQQKEIQQLIRINEQAGDQVATDALMEQFKLVSEELQEIEQINPS